MKYVDKNVALKYLANSEKIFNKIKNSFLESYKDFATELHRFMDLDSMDELYRYIHSIKGISLNLGSMTLYEDSCTMLDKIKKEEELLPDLERFIYTLRNVYDELQSL